ncbi:arsenate reductase [Pedobacter gandavensis]|uniref:Spx/MgsR family RNA polymerase-binding regulatory protein n=1 Tax=Pedobacter gandavensis TaxID=2679963 RepID=A0ABR6EWE6_9SPHI|nr:arsenate reductase [Pedobacter gandavensis]MBB2149595.1 Spx/MgsR family RNA polymerase-binding regulatory protein [Pedobacter gandavensis]
MIIYGIPNCNTVKKARTWLAEQGFNPLFHDFKKQGITVEKLDEWCSTFGWEKVLNKKGTTWKKLSPEQQGNVVDQNSAIEVLLNHTSAIKRPVVELNGKAILIGFDEAAYETILK